MSDLQHRSAQNSITTERRQRESTDEAHSGNDIVILQPITMRIPNSHGIYSPSKLRSSKEMSYEEFLSRYADHPRKIRVCFDATPSSDTLLQKSHLVTAYGFGHDSWYIVVGSLGIFGVLLEGDC